MKTLNMFLSYAQEDEAFAIELEKRLISLKRQRYLSIFHMGTISPGQNWRMAIENGLKTADIILLLISPDFMESDYCYNEELQRALERHHKEQVCVIPIIIRPTHWKSTPIGNLQALPKNAEPISTWENYDRAYFNVVDEIEKTVLALGHFQSTTSLSNAQSWHSESDIRQSNLSSQRMSFLTNTERDEVETELAIRKARRTLRNLLEQRDVSRYLEACKSWRRRAEVSRKAGNWTQEIQCWTILIEYVPYDKLAGLRLPIAEDNQGYVEMYEEAKQLYRAGDKEATKKKLLELWQKAPFYGDPGKLARRAGFRIFVPLAGWRKVIWSTLLLGGIALSIGPAIAIILAACGIHFVQNISGFFLILGILAVATFWILEDLHRQWIQLNLASTNMPSANKPTTHSSQSNLPRR